MGPDHIDRVRKAQELHLESTGAGVPAPVSGDPALHRLNSRTPDVQHVVEHDGLSFSADMLEELGDIQESPPLTAFLSRPQVTRALAVGGLLLGCAAGAFALGTAGFVLSVVAEALAFGGGILMAKASKDQLEEENRKLRARATQDSMTGINNRGSIDDILREQLLRVPFGRSSLSVILADVDHFKKINDSYGHQVGDEVLIEVARRLKSSMRAEDAVGRYGGEEFLMVLPGITGPQATLIAHRIRLMIADQPFATSRGALPITMSLGVAATDYPRLVPSDDLVGAADEALYRAKHEGRNRVVLAPPE